MRIAVKLALVVLLLACGGSKAAGGECVDGIAEYVAALEAGPSDRLFDYALSCLSSRTEGRLWAGPNAAAEFAALRADTLRPRLGRALSNLMVSSWADSADRRERL